MPRTITRPIVGLVPMLEAARLLGISDRSFLRHWQCVFSDKRPVNERGKGTRRLVFADELTEACAAGGGVLHGAKVAVLNFRLRIGRK